MIARLLRRRPGVRLRTPATPAQALSEALRPSQQPRQVHCWACGEPDVSFCVGWCRGPIHLGPLDLVNPSTSGSPQC